VAVFAAPVFAARYYYAPLYDYYPPPYYYYPPPAYYPPDGQVYWYYCAAVRGYYPQVQSCAGGWQKVVPQPPPG
jgi:hypothetical protein